MCYNQNNQGYVLLLTLLIIGAVGLVITLSFLLTGVGNTKSTSSLEQANQARALANACVEDALQTLNENNGFTGWGFLTLGQGSCSYNVVSVSPSVKNIMASSTVGNVVRRVQAFTDQVSPQVGVSSWKEVDAYE